MKKKEKYKMSQILEKIEKILNEGIKPKITFYTTHFERSHGKKPNGFGTWAFDINDSELVKLLAKHKNVSDTHNGAVFVKGSMQLNQAKKIIKDAILDVWPSDAKKSYIYVEVAP